MVYGLMIQSDKRGHCYVWCSIK